jgi:hypothetical protein
MVARVNSWGSLSERMFMLLPENKHMLQWISGDKAPQDCRVPLNKVTRLFFGPAHTKRLKGIKSKVKGREHLCLGVGVSESSSPLELVFGDARRMALFVTGLQLFVNDSHKALIQGSLQERKLTYLRQLWTDVDKNADGRLDIKEVELLLNRLNYNVEKSLLKDMFKRFDRDRSGYIDF